MAEGIYPGGLRENYFANMYCEIAMESYYNAEVSYEHIIKSGYSHDCFDEFDIMKKAIVSTIVFSAMTIEAFINDYAAACLGDSDFYENFDRLPLLSKFDLIVRFILKDKIDKSKAYYCYLKILFRERDSYIHSKSKRSSFQGYTLEELEELEKNKYLCESEVESTLFDKDEVQDAMKTALNALKAIREIAAFFDERDSNALAKIKLFWPTSVLSSPSKLSVLQLLGIEVDRL